VGRVRVCHTIGRPLSPAEQDSMAHPLHSQSPIMASHKYRRPGSPELTEADVPGTQFLLAHESGQPVDKGLARRRQFLDYIDTGRRAALLNSVPIGGHTASSRGYEPACKRAPYSLRALEAREALVMILSRLNKGDRMLVRLLFVEERSQREVARLLGTDRNAIQYHWKKVRARIAELLGEDK
jgi:RNA polymerase sigma factor (sigma-70 family)